MPGFETLAPYVLPPLINTAGNIASTSITNQANVDENRATREYNLKLWNMQNAYNTPTAQMQRFKDAGLNTNLMVSQGSTGNAAPPAAASPAHYNAPEVNLPNVLGLLSQFQDYKLREAETALKEEQEGYWANMNDRSLWDNILDYGSVRGYTFMKDNNQVWDDLKGGLKYQKQAAMIANMQSDNLIKRYIQNLKKNESILSNRLLPYNATVHDNILYRQMQRVVDSIQPGVRKSISDWFHPFRTIDQIKLDMDRMSKRK